MGQSLSNILTHIIFSTKDRQPFIHDRIELRLYGYIKAICQDHECHLLQIGGISNQKEHHKVISFQEEYLRFLKTYGMKYDEKYLWEWRAGLSGLMIFAH